MTEINLDNGLKSTYGYGARAMLMKLAAAITPVSGKSKPVTGGRLRPAGSPRHTWDAGGNLANRYNALASNNEVFGHDFLDRLTSVSGNYSDGYGYNQIGNIVSMNGVSYTYPTHGVCPHAATQVGSGNYTYDANGNMLTQGSANITWDAKNRPISITTANGTNTFVYDGDGNRVKKTDGGQTILYINKYFEKNLTAGSETSYYYLGGRLVAMRQGSDNVTYIHRDHLTGTLVVSDSGGSS